MSIGQSTNCFKCALSVALNASGSETVFYVDKITTMTGETLTTAAFSKFGKGVLTIDPLSSSNIEFASFTGVDGSAISFTGGTRGLSAFDYTASSSRAKYHPVGTTCIISFGTHNLSDILTYIDGVIAGSIGNASSTVAGITKLSINPTAPTSPIAAGANNTQSGTVLSSTNSIVDTETVKTYTNGYAADAGATDSYVITLSPAPTSYTAGMRVNFKANTANTGAATLNVNSLGAKTIKKNYNSDLSTGDILAGQIVSVVYDSTGACFQLLSPSASSISVVASSQTTKNLADASTTQTIAHGLGVTPKKVRIRGIYNSQPTTSPGIVFCDTETYYTNSTQSSIYNYVVTGDGNSSTGAIGATFTIRISSSGDHQTGVVTVDATNISIAWTKSGSPTGTAYLLWEAIA